ncbi:hypothetical protein [Beijerinckia sp. L45]|uniref:hypothetical protein n=1 Tax=Beijerinckia sp. L45 TaxID=1641855 RepID=UPI00131E3ACE|nr:hypothetical protein [Beijerinckia sp. L45]
MDARDHRALLSARSTLVRRLKDIENSARRGLQRAKVALARKIAVVFIDVERLQRLPLHRDSRRHSQTEGKHRLPPLRNRPRKGRTR